MARRLAFGCWLALAFTGCALRTPTTRPAGALEETIVGLANEMTENASSLDVRRNLPLIPETNKVVYVSDGVPITGNEYAKELGASYRSRRHLSFHWDRWEVTPIGEAAAAYTGWATVTIESGNGETTTQRYIYTMVFANDGKGWKRILAQKAVLRDDT